MYYLGRCLWIFCVTFRLSNKWLSRYARYFTKFSIGGAVQFIFGPSGVSFIWILGRSSLGGTEAWHFKVLLISYGVSDFLISDYVLSFVGGVHCFMYTKHTFCFVLIVFTWYNNYGVAHMYYNLLIILKADIASCSIFGILFYLGYCCLFFGSCIQYLQANVRIEYSLLAKSCQIHHSAIIFSFGTIYSDWKIR